jgi:NADPH2:quinone reductase
MAAAVKFDELRGAPANKNRRRFFRKPGSPQWARADYWSDPKPVRNLQLTYRSVTLWRMAMRAIEAKTFSGYGGLRQTELPKPKPARDRVLVRVTAAGVTPLDHTILSGGHPRAKAPLVLGNEGAGVIEDAGESGLAVGSRVMFTGPYGVGENGAWQDWLLARPGDLVLVPDAIGDVVAASLPVAYLTAQTTLTLAGFKPGKTVLAPGIGGSVGNATYQLARAQGAGKVISTAGSAAKAAKARELGFEDVIDLTAEGLAKGVRRIMAGKGVDIVIESIGGTVTSEALSSLGLGGVLITLGYSAGRKTTIDVTDLIWKRARMAGFSLFAQSPTAIAAAWQSILPLIVSGSVKPIVERVYPFSEAAEALRHLIEDRPFGKVVLAG